jgi:hypothetical protein
VEIAVKQDGSFGQKQTSISLATVILHIKCAWHSQKTDEKQDFILTAGEPPDILSMVS